MNKKQTFLIDGPVTPEIISAFLHGSGGDKGCGGHSLFLGQVRDDMVDKKKVVAIEYSAYGEMVDEVAESLIEQTKTQFNDIHKIDLLHSVGRVEVGEVSLMIIVSAGHRDHATKGCRHLLELVKENLPVWKKELFEDESHLWK